MLYICSCRHRIRYGPHRKQHRRHDQNPEEEQKERVEHLAHPDEDAGRTQGEAEDDGKECEGKGQQCLVLHDRRNKRCSAHLKGDGCRARNCKEGTDAEIECAGEGVGKAPSDLSADVEETFACRDADRCNAEQRQSDPCDAEADECGQHRRTRLLTHRSRKDEVARTKDQTEQQRGDKEVFLFSETVFHHFNHSA